MVRQLPVRSVVRMYLTNYRLTTALIVCISALLLTLCGNAGYAYWLIAVYSIVVAVLLAIGMIRKLFHGQYGVDILAVVAIVSTLVVGEYWATIVIVLMMVGGEALERYATERARSELAALLDRAPTQAHKQMIDGSTRDVPLESIQIRDIIVVRPGEVVPVDGVVVMGESTLDQSSLTGESVPVEVGVSSEVMSGVVNGESPLVIRATAAAADSQYAQIVMLVKQASEARAPFVRLADRYAVPFTLVSFVIAGIAWWWSGEPRRFAEVLVVATPCPLLIAAPVAMISGMSRSAKHGVIVKSGAVLEKLSEVRAVAFDKTGTLTTGRLAVGTIVPANGVESQELIRLALSVEQQSGHVTADALRAYASAHGISPVEVGKTQEYAGGGVRGSIRRRVVLAGKKSFLVKHGVPASLIPEHAGTTTYVAQSKKYLGYITYEDTVRADAHTTIRKLKTLGALRFVMLTGDKEAAAQTIAKELGITDVHAELLPQDKLRAVQDFPVKPIMMVGDGVNDAPVLSASDVGVAMGARGATAASESADVVIMVDELSRLVSAVSTARRTIHIARQSVMLGILISIGLMLAAALGLIPALLGAILQEAVDAIVIVNALRAHTDRVV